MGSGDAARQQIPRQPAQLVVELRLIRQRRRAVRLSQVFGLDELRSRVDLTYLAHGENDAATLVQQRTAEHALVTAVGIPQSVEPTEPRRREGLVDRRVALDPWIST